MKQRDGRDVPDWTPEELTDMRRRSAAQQAIGGVIVGLGIIAIWVFILFQLAS